MVRVAEARVVVEGHLAVHGPHGAVGAGDQRVDLNQGRILIAVDGPQGLEDRGDGLRRGLVEARFRGDTAGDLGVNAATGSRGTRARASGRSFARVSMSMPPSREHIARWRRFERSSRIEK